MTNKDIISLYLQGYSIDYISNRYYKDRTINDIPNHRFNSVFIVTKKSCTYKNAKNKVERVIYEFAVSNKAN